MATVSAAEIIGKTLYALKPVVLKRFASDSAPGVYTVKPGSIIGVVKSFVEPRPGTNANLYWMYYDNNNNAFYSEMITGYYDFKVLQQQGVLTTEEKLKAEAEANKPVSDKIISTVKWLGIAVGVAILGKAVIETIGNRKK